MRERVLGEGRLVEAIIRDFTEVRLVIVTPGASMSH
jgi:hypothetical protein